MVQVESKNNKIHLYDDPLKIYLAMLDDIRSAKSKIFLQTYKFGNDNIGQKFRHELVRKAKAGVEVKILIDSWGAGVSEFFFEELIKNGGEVIFFEKIQFSFDVFARNHRRNHRKLLIIDSEILYIGSANITSYCLNWRESTLRIPGTIAIKFEKLFFNDINNSKKFYLNKRLSTRILRSGDIEIIRDVPGNIPQPVRKKYQKLIKTAKEEIIIETPYFLPGSIMRKNLIKAASRGVKIIILTPLNSDVMLFDILRNKYFGLFYRKNIQILQYTPGNLHAKVMLVDGKMFFMGSSNFDYRSFRFMHEINIAGENEEIVSLLHQHLNETMKDCVEFDYIKWKNRHLFLKMLEWILVPLRHLF